MPRFNIYFSRLWLRPLACTYCFALARTCGLLQVTCTYVTWRICMGCCQRK